MDYWQYAAGVQVMTHMQGEIDRLTCDLKKLQTENEMLRVANFDYFNREQERLQCELNNAESDIKTQRIKDAHIIRRN